jgi:hypothetical protein
MQQAAGGMRTLRLEALEMKGSTAGLLGSAHTHGHVWRAARVVVRNLGR